MTTNRWVKLALVGFAMFWTAGCETMTGDSGDNGNNTGDTSQDGSNNNGDSNDQNDGNTGDTSDDGQDGNNTGDNTGDDTGDDTGDNTGTDDQSGNTGDDPVDDTGDDMTGDDMNTDGMIDDDMMDDTESGTWTKLTQPCGGTRANAFWFDSRMDGYIGCGDNAAGFGLYVTDDGGETWESQSLFNGARINDIRRGPDGVLYATGTDTVDSYEVFTVDESGPVRQLVGLYQSGGNAFTSVSQGENIAVTEDGQLFVDSLTGTQTAYRAAGAANFMELETHLDGVLTGGSTPGEQMSRVIGFNNRFWGVGSVINRPGTVYYPSNEPGATYHMKKVEVQPSTRDGELHDIYMWSETSGLVIGFDQSLRYPLIHRLTGDASDAANWAKIDLFNSGIDYQGGAWKMAVRGDEVVLVGQTFPNNHGFVVHSMDRGMTWTDVSPVDENDDFVANLMSNVWYFEDDTILVTAESGELWRYNP